MSDDLSASATHAFTISAIEDWLDAHKHHTGMPWGRDTQTAFDPSETLWLVKDEGEPIESGKAPWLVEVCHFAGFDHVNLRLTCPDSQGYGFRFDEPGKGFAWSSVFSGVAGAPDGRGTAKYLEVCRDAGVVPFIEFGEKTRFGVQCVVPLAELTEDVFGPMLDGLRVAAAKVVARFQPSELTPVELMNSACYPNSWN